MGMTQLGMLNQQIRDAVLKTPAGGASAPFLDAAGIEIFVRCDKAVPELHKVIIPTRDQVREQLFEDQITALARRFSRDLRRNANIEIR